jgi:5-methyltetrahydropteroyltriglutamate--homocysteine methyltransferase
MRASSDRILTTHVGSLPRPDDMIEANRSREAGEPGDEAAFQVRLRGAVGDVVERQRTLGIDVAGDGEFGKSMGHRVNFGAWMSYAYHRLGGLDLGGPDMHDLAPRRSGPGQLVLTSFADRRDRARFAAAYADPDRVSTGPDPRGAGMRRSDQLSVAMPSGRHNCKAAPRGDGHAEVHDSSDGQRWSFR